MIFAKKSPSGRLTDMSQREQQTYADGSMDVPLNQIPQPTADDPLARGPWVYDTVNRLAVFDSTGRDNDVRLSAKTALRLKTEEVRALRCLVREIHAELELLKTWILANKTFLHLGTQPDTATWAQIMSQADAKIDAETDPNT